MNVLLDVNIDARKETVWKIITDIENSAETISGIEKIEVLEKPKEGLSGLKWEETRIMFGRTATEIMWITDVKPLESYQTKAEGPGVEYVTQLSLADQGDQTILSMEFRTKNKTFVSKIMASTMGLFFSKATKDAIQQDLLDIKAAAENIVRDQ